MGGSLQQAVDTLVAQGQWWALPLLGGAAAIEYIFPPFPGDTVTLAGAVLARIGNWSVPLVFGALLVGNLAGAMADYLFGRTALNPERLAHKRGGQMETIERLLRGFRRYGPALLVVNRFLPGIRALFFVAAGMARLSPVLVMLYAAISATLWTAMLLVAGAMVGDNLPLLEDLFARYMQWAWLPVIGLVAYLLYRRIRR